MAALTPDCCVSCGEVVNGSDAVTTRASLEVARVALGRMMGVPAASEPHGRPLTMATRGRDGWNSVESVVRALTGRNDLAGQALLTEARSVDALDMDGMHALVALREWVERTMSPGSAAQMLTIPPTDAETEVASTALAALERASVGSAAPGVGDAPTPPDTSLRSQWAPQPSADPGPEPSVAPIRKPVSSMDAPESVADGGRSLSSGAILGMLLLIVAIAIGALGWFFYSSRTQPATSSLTEEGVAAYARGAKDVARTSLLKSVQENPNDARALTYLARIEREQGSIASAQQYLETAVRADPNSALASRELASALLADRQYELARRFYVRAVKLDPNDRVAQGFLGCALLMLNRTDEATRWMERAGVGEWLSCSNNDAVIAPPAKN